MGSSLVRGWLAENLIEKIQIVDPNEIDESFTHLPTVFHVKHFDSVDFQGVSLCVLATKPQIMDNVCKNLKPYVSNDISFLSIAAGVKIDAFETQLGTSNIIRSMPNTPAAIGKGMTVLCATSDVPQEAKDAVTNLMNAVGQIQWIDNEEMMDAVTAVSGSGPAYLFYFIEALAKSAEKQGFAENDAYQLAVQTVIGAAALAENDASKAVHELRKNVTSPGGTTEAGLSILMDGRLDDILNETLDAATQRGKELGKN